MITIERVQAGQQDRRVARGLTVAWFLKRKPRAMPLLASSRVDQLDASLTALDVALRPQLTRLETAGSPPVT
jgi:aryl-alcohol dehydrogenase-like predicted oxidoreductase